MLSLLFDDTAERMRSNMRRIYALLIVGNVGAWLWALIAFHSQPLLLGTAFLAYSFGLRHAFDADHIAAIDNVTRKLMQEGRRPIAVGFFFSLGHSTIVLALIVVIALTASALQGYFDALKDVGGFIGTSVSALFLFAIAAVNIVVLGQVYRAFQTVKAGGRLVEADIHDILAKRGFLARTFRPVFQLIKRSWHMYPLGLLFGLGFDTATEVGLLGLSAMQATQGLSIWSILVFPALFTAGMSLMDTTGSALMVGTYGWAFVKPLRKLYYNMTITFVSVIAALVVGGIEALGMIAYRLGLGGPFWDFIAMLSDNFGLFGYGMVAFFIACWLISFVIYKAKGFDRVEISAART
jgi:nickel/cobalt transporter (NiCoT) family protein